MGQRLVVEVDDDVMTLRAPFCNRRIPRTEVLSAVAAPDDGLNHGLVHWFVTGSATSPQGVRLNTGGHAWVDIRTPDGRRYVVVLDDLAEAQEVAAALPP